MHLLALPNELLAQIASYFKHDSDIYALMRANTRLYHLLDSYLYQHNARFFGGWALSWTVRSGDLVGARKAVEAGALGKGSQFFDSELLDSAILSGNAETVSLLLENDMRSIPRNLFWLVSECGRESDSDGESEVEDQEDNCNCNGKDKRQYQFHRSSSLALALVHGNEAVVRVLVRNIKKSLEQKDGKETQLNISENDEVPLQQLHRLDIIPSKDGAREVLRNAAAKGDLATVKLLKEHLPGGPSNNKTWPFGHRTPLVQAAMNGEVEVLKYLLSAGLDPNLDRSSPDKTPLYYAARHNQIETAQLLLDHGVCADPPLGDSQHTLRILDTAGRRGFTAMAKLLLKHIDVNSKVPGNCHERDSLMVTAAACGLADLLQLVLDRDPSSYSDVPWGKRRFVADQRTSLLLKSVRNSHQDVAALLLDYGAKPYGTVNKSPLLEAVSRDNADIVQLLLDRGVKINLKGHGHFAFLGRRMFDKDLCPIGMVALCHAIETPSMFRLLLDRGVHINHESTAAIVLRTEIARSGSNELSDILREKGYLVEKPEEHQAYISLSAANPEADNLRLIASVNPAAPHVMNILQDAIPQGDLVTVTYLLERGCDANLEGFIQPDEPSIVEVAVRASDPEAAAAMLDVLLRHGANINALKGSPQPEWNGYNKDEQHQAAIQILIERGARTDSANGKWVKNTLLHCGDYVHFSTMQYLLRVMCDRGMSLDEFQVHKGTIDEQASGCHCWGIERVLENIYWRIKYPVP
ncbi:hypothetical protein SI65_04439 [Aspergillus cristatus]|uniref:Uncharacterized protein n=1 Tax=Aspergillus cristatus TaxID=573508 RepID=A0A1E3BEQ1_ASPCR|nr:hypothetical protein SI65_04439 [Aspergillus cristatus]